MSASRMAFFHRLLVSWGFISFSSSAFPSAAAEGKKEESSRGKNCVRKREREREREREKGGENRKSVKRKKRSPTVVVFLFSTAFYRIIRVRSINDRIKPSSTVKAYASTSCKAFSNFWKWIRSMNSTFFSFIFLFFFFVFVPRTTD